MLKLRAGRVKSVVAASDRVAEIEVEVGPEVRRAVAYPALTGGVAVADEVIVNTEALDLGLGSGGFDIVCANLTRGLDAEPASGAHTMKLNYSPLQHSVKLLEEDEEEIPGGPGNAIGILALHAQLAPVVFALKRTAPDARVGYVQTVGGALPGALSDTVAELRDRGLLAAHITAGAAFGGEYESATVAAALACGADELQLDAAIVGPGPGIQGSSSALGHGGMAALDAAHAALALGAEPVIVPRVSSADERPRHRGLSHHTATVLQVLLAPVNVALPDARTPFFAEVAAELRGLNCRCDHRLLEVGVDTLVDQYGASGLPATTMGRTLDEDRGFFESALAGGAVLAERLGSAVESG